MSDFFQEGGFFMWPILVLGIVLVVASIRYAIDCRPIRLRFIKIMSLSLVAMSFLGTFLGIGVSLRAVVNMRLTDFKATELLWLGISESTRNLELGFTLLNLSLIIVAIGAFRAGRKELRSPVH